MFAIFALLLEGTIFGYWPLSRFEFIPNTDLKDGSCNFVVSNDSSIVLFFAVWSFSVLHLGGDENAKHTKMLNILHSIYLNHHWHLL